MDLTLKQKFIERWNKYFPGVELPITFYYTNEEGRGNLALPPKGFSCVICDLEKTRIGTSQYFDTNNVGCFGGKRYFGFLQELRPNFEYFLSCGIPGKMEGERYKKSPELVKEYLKYQPSFVAPGKYIVFKRWDKLEQQDQPLAVIFFAQPDVLAGLFTLANYDEHTPNGVIAPFGSGCSSIVYFPFLEYQSPTPKAVIGMFDVSARPCVPNNVLTFSVPLPKFARMVDNMDESFLITDSWNNVRRRLNE